MRLMRAFKRPGWWRCPMRRQRATRNDFANGLPRAAPAQWATLNAKRRMGDCCGNRRPFPSPGRARRWFALPAMRFVKHHFRPKRQTARSGWIARYAWSSRANERGERRPSDYHKVLLKRMRAVEARLHEAAWRVRVARVCRHRARLSSARWRLRPGLGGQAKNTCLIHPKLGSFGFLAVIADVARSHCKGQNAGRLRRIDAGVARAASRPARRMHSTFLTRWMRRAASRI